MYNIGDKIVYPMHGAGVIEAIEVKKFLKEKKSYYIMKIATSGMVLMIPTDNTEEIGVRSIVDKQTAQKVIKEFSTPVGEFNENWNKRYRENMLKIRTGNIFEVLKVVKDLMVHDRQKGLSTGERKMLNNSKHILLRELVLAQSKDYTYLDKILEEEIEKLTQG